MGNEQSQQSQPALGQKPEQEEEDDFDLDKIQGDDDPTPPLSPQLPPLQRNPKKADSKVRKIKKKKEKRKAADVEDIFNVEQPASSDVITVRRRVSPENFHEYASSDPSEQGSLPLSRSSVRGDSGASPVQGARKSGLRASFSTILSEPSERDFAVPLVQELKAKTNGIYESRSSSIMQREQIPKIASMLSPNECSTKGGKKKGNQKIKLKASPDRYGVFNAGGLDGDANEMQKEFLDINQPTLVTIGTQEAVVTTIERVPMTGDEMQGAQGGSSEHVSSPDNIFESADSPAPATDNSEAKASLKRKRDDQQNPDSAIINALNRNKKRKRDLCSPASSAEPAHVIGPLTKRKNSDVAAGPPDPKPKSLKEKLRDASQPTIGSWVKSLSSDASLRHPIFNPASPRKSLSNAMANITTQNVTHAEPSNASFSVLIPKRGRGRSRKMAKQSADAEPSTSKIQPGVVSTSPKGKKRAELGIEYVSPLPIKPREIARPPNLGAHGDEEMEEQLATSFARRSFPRRRKSSPTYYRPQIDAEDSLLGPHDAITGANSPLSDCASNFEEQDKVINESTSSEESENDHKYVCKICHKKLKAAGYLELHMKQKGIHKNLQRCSVCSKHFCSARALKEHQNKESHKDITSKLGHKGPFSVSEIRKIEKWRDAFCAEHDLLETTFNDLMADSCRRGRDVGWSWEFITKKDLMDQYYGILPNRDRRSMLRYRERNFQVVQATKEWAKEDDDDLENLVNELGTKWVEIGQRLNRSSDAVSQRWRNKVKDRHQMRGGIWESQETEILETAVQKLKRKLGASMDESSDDRIAWAQVSNEIGNIRTAQQCSNHWKWLRQEHRFTRLPRTRKDAAKDTDPKVKGKGKRGRPKGSKGIKRRRTTEGTDEVKRARPSISDEYVIDSEQDEEAQEHSSGAEDDQDEPEPAISESTIQDSQPKPTAPSETRRCDSPTDGRHSEAKIKFSKKASRVISDAQSTGNVTLQLPRKLLAITTPTRTLTMSQAFQQTQANSSAVRGPATALRKRGAKNVQVEDSQEHPERPSPEIEVKLQPDWSGGSDDELISHEGGVAEGDFEEAKTHVKASQELGAAVIKIARENDEPEYQSEEATSTSGSTSSSDSGSEEGEEDSMVEDTRDDFEAANNDFMANVNALATKKQGRTVHQQTASEVEDNDSDDE